MNNIKSEFSIKDLENLSGIKAHTIRIWEKRYNLLSPKRTDTNIRTYDEKSLQKLLNVSFLNNNGYKISKIAELSDTQIPILVEKISLGKGNDNHPINELKIAMLNFDQRLFIETYNQLSKTRSFEQIFNEIIIPLLDDIGLLWQTNTISPANEHFISALIRQKLLINIESLQINIDYSKKNICVLFLPENEIHELGLMFLQYLLLQQKIYSIYLGQSVPIDGLKDLVKLYGKITFISYFTIRPETDKIESYLKTFSNEILVNDNYKLWVLGRKLNEAQQLDIPKNVKIIKSIDAFKKLSKSQFRLTTFD